MDLKYYTFLLVTLQVLSLLHCITSVDTIDTFKSARSFTIKGDDFLKDGQPFRIVAGSMHLWRCRPEDWVSRLQMAQLMGLNTITTYFNWGLHEKEPGKFSFSGDLDVVKWIQTANQLGLLVIARVGPYITAEVDFGG